VSEGVGVTACFSRRVGAWFAGEGRASVADPVYLRQMNMAIALAASRWNEFAGDPDAAPRMRDWLDEVRRRALERKAHARVEAIDLARAWFDGCAGNG
jgi:glutathione S-transferase